MPADTSQDHPAPKPTITVATEADAPAVQGFPKLVQQPNGGLTPTGPITKVGPHVPNEGK